MEETSLTLSLGGFPPFAARGCTQDLMPIASCEAYRTVNGELVTTTTPLHHKYQTVIKGKDKLPIALDQLWKGQDVDVGCIQRLWQKADGLEVLLSRAPVTESVIAMDENRQSIDVISVDGRQVTLRDLGFVGYRPLLKMKITDFGYETEEWGSGSSSWYLKLEEV